jgi:hypothetical protein
MRATRIATLVSLAVTGSLYATFPAWCQEMRPSWQTQRFASVQLPGHQTSAYREMSRGFAGLHIRDSVAAPAFRTNTAVGELADSVDIRDGHANFFNFRPEEMPGTQISGQMDGHGAHLVISLP